MRPVRRVHAPRIGEAVVLRNLIETIGRNYDRSLNFQSPAQRALTAASSVIEPLIPAGYVVQGSGGKGAPATVPWIAIFDPDETDSARHGMYVVYLFSADQRTVHLSLNQGVTELVEKLGTAAGRNRLKEQATFIRDAIDPASLTSLTIEIDLSTSQSLPRHYEFGNIAARTYDVTQLPTNAVMVSDLIEMIRLYDAALEARELVRRTNTSAIATTTATKPEPQKTTEFKPKNDAEYHQQISARTLIKQRRHETLIKEYGAFLQQRGFTLATNVHPRDLTATRDGSHWLIEAKIVYRGNGVQATREAIGQLLEYRFVLYPEGDAVQPVALFSEHVGDVCLALLDHLGIVAVWKDNSGWVGTTAAGDLAMTHVFPTSPWHS